MKIWLSKHVDNIRGHDISDLKTFTQYSAAQDGKLVLRGVKNWVTNGKEADLLIVFGKLCQYEAEDLAVS